MTDAYDSSLPARSPPAPQGSPGGPHPPLPGGDEAALPPERRLTASKGLIGFGVAVAATLFAVAIIGVIYAAAGADLDDRSYVFVGTLIQAAALIGAAFFVTADLGRPTWATFGLRPFDRSAYKWLALAFLAYYAMAILYAAIFNPPSEELPKELGAEEGVGLAIATGVLLIGVAPVAEEIFFRGFLYQAFRNSYGVWPGAILSGLVFGVIHFEFFKLVQLAILGVILALLFERTRSLWPPIMLHAVNNTLAFIYLMADGG